MNKVDFAVIIGVKGANPNGDPSEENSPRRQSDGRGVISDICLKRKIRDRLADSGEPVFVLSAEKSSDGMMCLSDRYKAAGGTRISALSKFIDVRAFGSVFAYKKTEKLKKGKASAAEGDEDLDIKSEVSTGVRGAITIREAISVDPIDTFIQQITKSVNSEPGDAKGSDTMGKKQYIEKATYVAYGSINAHVAEQNGLSQNDVDKIKKAITCMFCNDESTARPSGSMKVIKVIWWEHSKKYGDASSWDVHNSIIVNNDGSYVLSKLPDGVSTYELNETVLD